MARESEEEAKLRWVSTPTGFAVLVLGLHPYWWQTQVLEWFKNANRKPVRGGLCTPNGSGKSAVCIASLIFWWLSVYSKGRVVITTKSDKQLDGQIWQAIRQFSHKFPSWNFLKSQKKIETPTGGYAIGFTTDDPQRAEGWHKLDDEDGPLLIIIDEGKSVEESIYQGIDRCTYNAILVTSSPGVKSGRFYRIMSDANLGYRTLKVGFTDCPHKPKHIVDSIIATWGLDHPFTRSTLFGEFMEEDPESRFVIPMSKWLMCKENPPLFKPGNKVAFCDFAAGRDENVMAVKEGNRVSITDKWRSQNTMESVARFIMAFKREGLNPGDIYGDNSGMGGRAFIDRMSELGWPINRVEFGGSPLDATRYKEKVDEMWFTAADQIDKLAIILPDDDILEAQVCQRRIKDRPDEISQMVSKTDMAKKYSYPSPDRADCVLGVISIDSVLQNPILDTDGLATLDAAAQLAVGTSHGIIERNGTTCTFRVSDAPWITIYERAIYGMKYLCVVMPNEYGSTKDHVCVIIRGGYMRDGKKWINTKVAAVFPSCRWDTGPFCDFAVLAAAYYGNCMIVPIVRDRLDVVEGLRARGHHLYARRDIEKVKGEKTKIVRYGWDSNDKTRSVWLACLADAIRDRHLDLLHRPYVTDLYRMGREDCEPSTEAIGVGLYLIGNVAPSMPPPTHNPYFDVDQPAVIGDYSTS